MRHVGWSSEPLLGSTDADGLPKIGRISITRRSHSCASHPSASCSENFVIPLDVPGRTLALQLLLREMSESWASVIRRSWTQAASNEETLALWAASLREIKKRSCSLLIFTFACPSAS